VWWQTRQFLRASIQSMRIKMGIGFGINFLSLFQTLPAIPHLKVFSYRGLLILFSSYIIIGLGNGLVCGCFWSPLVIEWAANWYGMGLGFATFLRSANTRVKNYAISQFFNLVTLLVSFSFRWSLIDVSAPWWIVSSLCQSRLMAQALAQVWKIVDWGCDNF